MRLGISLIFERFSEVLVIMSVAVGPVGDFGNANGAFRDIGILVLDLDSRCNASTNPVQICV